MERLQITITGASEGYELLDSGAGRKLERFGNFTFSRPDPGVLWPAYRGATEWNKAELAFTRAGKEAKWMIAPGVPKEWTIPFAGLTFLIRPTSFKHTGLFPEQAPNWEWFVNILKKTKSQPKVLNLFAYTGGASLAAAKAGAAVTHVDGSKAAIAWARANAEVSGLADKPIRWILDDVKGFLKKEAKRGNRYDGIIMDPPSFGRGPKDELWKIEDDFIELLDLARSVLSDEPFFVLLNGYAAGYSAIAYENALRYMTRELGGAIETGELALQESGSKRLLPAGIFARWSK